MAFNASVYWNIEALWGNFPPVDRQEEEEAAGALSKEIKKPQSEAELRLTLSQNLKKRSNFYQHYNYNRVEEKKRGVAQLEVRAVPLENSTAETSTSRCGQWLESALELHVS